MDKLILKDFFLKYWKYLVIALLIILLFHQCNKSKGLILDAKNHKENAEKYITQSRILQSHLQGLTVKYQLKIDSIIKVEKTANNKLSENTKLTNLKLSDLKHYISTDYTNYFKVRYNENNNVIQSENGTTLKDSVSKKVITDLIVGDGAKSEIKILRDVIQTKEDKFNLCNNTVDSLKLGLETVSKNYELANTEKDKALTDIEKAFKREKNKKNLWKLISLGVSVGAGYLLFIK